MKKAAVCGYSEKAIELCERCGVFQQFEIPFFYDRRSAELSDCLFPVKNYAQTLEAIDQGAIEAVIIPEVYHISTLRDILSAFLGKTDIYVVPRHASARGYEQIAKFPDPWKYNDPPSAIGIALLNDYWHVHSADFYTKIIEHFYGNIVKYYITPDINRIDGDKIIGFEQLKSIAGALDGVLIPENPDATWRSEAERFIKACRKCGVKNIYMPESQNWKIRKSIYRTKEDIQNLFTPFKQERPLGKLDIQLVDHCNLNCQGCTHFCPMVQKEWFYNVDDFASDIAKVSEIFGESFNQIAFLGGEPLLHPQLSEFIEITRSLSPNTDLVLITNGILLNSLSEEMLSLLRENEIIIAVSVYPNVSGYEKSILKLKSHGLKHIYFYNIDRFSTSIDLDGNSAAYDFCGTKYCHALRDGVIFSCYYPMLIHYFNEFYGTDLPSYESGQVVNLRQQNISYEEACEVLMKPSALCKYCSRGDVRLYKHTYIKPGSMPERHYWTRQQ